MVNISDKSSRLLCAVQYIIGATPFQHERHLAANSPERFSSRQFITLFEPYDLSLTISCHDHGLIHTRIDPGFKEERNVIDHDRLGIFACGLPRQSGLLARDTRMDDSLELSTLCPILKDNLTERLPVDRLITV